MFDIETTGLDEFEKTITDLEKNFPNETRKLLRNIGTKARTIVTRKARQLVGKKSGKYYKSIKRGRLFLDKRTGDWTIRVFTSKKVAPHAHLIERGHRIIAKDGTERGFQPGKHVFDKAGPEIDRRFNEILNTELDKIFSKL